MNTCRTDLPHQNLDPDEQELHEIHLSGISYQHDSYVEYKVYRDS